jgi:lipid-A-disaccharide synthase
MKVLLLAGEESGVLYAEKIAAEIRRRFPDAQIRGYGDYGFEIGDLAVMGFGAVLRKIFYFLRVKRTMEKAIRVWKPDAVCTVDYPGMNLKLAAFARRRGVRAVHVVCPQVWAWKAGRIPGIEAALDSLCCFFPFEPGLFRPGFARFVGHPLAADFPPSSDLRTEGGGMTVAVLPGSRSGEIERNLPVLLEACGLLAADRPGRLKFEIPAANERALAQIRAIMSAAPRSAADFSVTLGNARAVLRRAACAAVASGTATLEAALARCPTVLVYRVGALLAWFARRVIKGIRHVGLANIIAEKTGLECPMPELLQENFTAESVAEELGRYVADDDARRAAVGRLEAVVRELGDGAGAVAKTVDEIFAFKEN